MGWLFSVLLNVILWLTRVSLDVSHFSLLICFFNFVNGRDIDFGGVAVGSSDHSSLSLNAQQLPHRLDFEKRKKQHYFYFQLCCSNTRFVCWLIISTQLPGNHSRGYWFPSLEGKRGKKGCFPLLNSPFFLKSKEILLGFLSVICTHAQHPIKRM